MEYSSSAKALPNHDFYSIENYQSTHVWLSLIVYEESQCLLLKWWLASFHFGSICTVQSHRLINRRNQMVRIKTVHANTYTVPCAMSLSHRLMVVDLFPTNKHLGILRVLWYPNFESIKLILYYFYLFKLIVQSKH